MLFIISLIISICLAGSGLNVQDQLILMPYPSGSTFDKSSTKEFTYTDSIQVSIASPCSTNDGCKSFIQDNLNHSIFYPMSVMKNLPRFRVSLHDAIDIPEPTIESTISLNTLSISFTSSDINVVYPTLTIGVDESYDLNIDSNGISILAPTVYGVRHALETLLQLSTPKNGAFAIWYGPIKISDSPRMKWRGLMIDPSRNPIYKDTYYKIVDALAALKMNVLHIHLSDAQMFLFESKKYPNFSKARFSEKQTLTVDFIKDLVNYGKKRGVIIYPELDMPSHAASWNLAYPGVAANCWNYIARNKMRYGENIVALNPANQTTFEMISGLIEELAGSFETEYLHVGGDECTSYCWRNSNEYTDISSWMSDNKVSSWKDLENYFNKYSQSAVKTNKKTPVVWEEVFSSGVADPDTIVQVWNYIGNLSAAVNAGYKAIYSAGYYLDMQMPLCYDWNTAGCSDPNHMYVWTSRDFYNFDPVSQLTEDQQKLVLGGEACSWGESVDDENFFDRTFQRISPIAERFWSMSFVTDVESMEVRADYQRCTALRRHIYKGTGPLYSSICDLGEN